MAGRLSAELTRIAGQPVYLVKGRWVDRAGDDHDRGLDFVTWTLAGWSSVEVYLRPGCGDGCRILPIEGRFVPDEPLPEMDSE